MLFGVQPRKAEMGPNTARQTGRGGGGRFHQGPEILRAGLLVDKHFIDIHTQTVDSREQENDGLRSRLTSLSVSPD